MERAQARCPPMLIKLTEKEKVVMDEIFRQSDGGKFDIPAEEVNNRLPHLSNRQYAGFCSSLVKKGWIHSFPPYPDGESDFELSCEARLHYGVKRRMQCNHIKCRFCQRGEL